MLLGFATAILLTVLTSFKVLVRKIFPYMSQYKTRSNFLQLIKKRWYFIFDINNFFQLWSWYRCCEICGANAKNISGEENNSFMEAWHVRRMLGNNGNRSSSDGASCWRGQPFCNLLMACLVIAFILPWFFRVNIFWYSSYLFIAWACDWNVEVLWDMAVCL